MRPLLPPKLCCHPLVRDLAAALQCILRLAIWLLLSKTALPPNLLYLQLLTHCRISASTVFILSRIDSAAASCPRSNRQMPKVFRIFACSGAKLAGGLRNALLAFARLLRVTMGCWCCNASARDKDSSFAAAPPFQKVMKACSEASAICIWHIICHFWFKIPPVNQCFALWWSDSYAASCRNAYASASKRFNQCWPAIASRVSPICADVSAAANTTGIGDFSLGYK